MRRYLPSATLLTLLLAAASTALADPPAAGGQPAAIGPGTGPGAVPVLSMTGMVQQVDLQSGAVAVLAGPPGLSPGMAAAALPIGQIAGPGPLVFQVDQQTQIMESPVVPGQFRPWGKKKRVAPPPTQMGFAAPVLNKCQALRPGQLVRVTYVGVAGVGVPGQFGKAKPSQATPVPANPGQVPVGPTDQSAIPMNQIPPNQTPPAQTAYGPAKMADSPSETTAIAPPPAPDSSLAAMAPPTTTALAAAEPTVAAAAAQVPGTIPAPADAAAFAAPPAATAAFVAPPGAMPATVAPGDRGATFRALSIEVLSGTETPIPPLPGSVAPAGQPLPPEGVAPAGAEAAGGPA